MKKFVLYVIAAILSCMPAVAGNDVKIVNSSDAYIPLCSKKATKNLTKLMKGYLSRLEGVPAEVRMYHIYTVTDNSMPTFAALDSVSLMYKDLGKRAFLSMISSNRSHILLLISFGWMRSGKCRCRKTIFQILRNGKKCRQAQLSCWIRIIVR